MATLGYLDCFSGISGDMLLGALLDAGLPEQALRQALAGLPVEGWRLDVSRISQAGIAATRVQIRCDGAPACRHLGDIEEIISRAGLEPAVRQQAMAVFRRLARAEAAVHGCSEHTVHFHEVGALDCLVDVVGAVAGLHWLGVESLACSPLPMPAGWVRCDHGELPLPGPAVCTLLQGAEVYGVALTQELVTPTGAALVRELAERFGPLPPMRLGATGYGAGSRQRSDGRPNLLRLILGESLQPAECQQVEVIETNLDDMNMEYWPHVCELLLARQALDVSLVPLQTKKGRPGFLLRVVCDPAHGLALKQCILTETTAAGIRSQRMERMTLPRRTVTMQTPWGAIEAKEIQTPAGPVITPEYEACRSMARKHNLPIAEVYRLVTGLAANKRDGEA